MKKKIINHSVGMDMELFKNNPESIHWRWELTRNNKNYLWEENQNPPASVIASDGHHKAEVWKNNPDTNLRCEGITNKLRGYRP